MFDLGFWELMLIGVVALLVVGPERLPGLARTAGQWLGRLRRFVRNVKQDIDQELAAEELQKTLSQQAGIPELEEIIEETKGAVNEVKNILGSGGQPQQSSMSEDQLPDSKNKQPDNGTT